jgi:hypothetical protein
MTLQRKIVTSFSKAGYELYGKTFLESYRDVGNDIPLEVYSEDMLPIEHSKPWTTAHIGYRTAAAAASKNYRYQASRFRWKPGALVASLFKNQANWTIWIDGDVEFKKKFDEEFWEQTTNQNNLFTYIGRDVSWDHSECGFVAYATGHPVPIRFIQDLWELYNTGKVFRLREWHDSYVFDWLAGEKYGPWHHHFLNIAEGIDTQHPWPDTILGEYMAHYKGPVAKGKKYGRMVESRAVEKKAGGS